MLNQSSKLMAGGRTRSLNGTNALLSVFTLLMLLFSSAVVSANPACVSNEITQMNLVDAPSGVIIDPLTNNYVINKALISGSFNIDALPCNGLVGSVVFSINGAPFRTESAAPYALTGDKNGAFKSWNPGVGVYTITATPYTGSGGSGAVGVALSITVQVIDQSVTSDCNGDLNGNASFDQCGVCSGGNTGFIPNASCTDCNGVVNGTAATDACGICAGGNTGATPNACFDCAGVLNGSAAIDACGICAGGTTGKAPDATCLDCDNVPNGGAVTDDCGDCVLGNTGLAFNSGCNIDCAGVINGTAFLDSCGVCAGGATLVTPNASCKDCDGVINGTASIDACGVCSGGATGLIANASCVDCDGVPNGTATLDTCGVCAGGATGIIPNASCGSCVPNEVTTLMLIDASTGLNVAPMNNNTVINLQVLPSFSVRADVCSDPDVESVQFVLDGNTIRTESVPPYAVNGDYTGGYHPWPLSTGSYTLTAIPYSSNKAQGTAGVAKVVTFIVSNGPLLDCNNDTNGTASIDLCGICAGGATGIIPNASCSDCDGVPNGTALVDTCGICAGGATGIVPGASCTDCAGVVNGTANIDACGVCAGGTTGKTPDATCLDCNNVPNGSAVTDDCGDCVLGNTGLAFNSGCNIDCAGVIDGNAATDNCGVCAGGTTGITPDLSCTDCLGVVNGTASVDACGICTGGTSGLTPNASCSDCAGVPNGTAAVDTCNVCAGGSTGIVPNSSCGGGACSPNEVTVIMLINAGNGQDLGGLSNGDTIDLSVLPAFSARADVCSEPAVESVVFNLNGTNIRTENVAPYSVNGDNNGNYSPWLLSAGTYTISCTPYSGNNNGGTQGIAKVVTFYVVDGPPVSDCNGDVGGSAYLDACGTCVGGNTGKTACTPPAGCGDFIEQGGLVVVELESQPTTHSDWYVGTGPVSGLNIPAPSGSYYMWKENCVSGTAPNYSYGSCGGTTSGTSIKYITYSVSINTPGRYRFQIRSWQPNISTGGHKASTENNDCWLRLPDGGGIKKKGTTEIAIATSEHVKVYQNSVNGWRWESNTVDNNPHFIYIDFATAGSYDIEIGGRSKLFAIDRFVLYRSDNAADNVAEAYATSLSRGESPRGGCGAKVLAGVDQTHGGTTPGLTANDQSVSNSLGVVEPTEAEQFRINAYPNPTTGMLYLEIVPANSEAVIELYDATGKLLLKQMQKAEDTSIDLSAYADGLYWIKVNTGEAVRMERIYKK